MCSVLLFFFNDPATTEIYTDVHTLSLHDALPISEDQVFEHLAMKDRQVRTQVQADFRIAGDRLDGFPEICLQLMRGPHFAQRQVFGVVPESLVDGVAVKAGIDHAGMDDFTEISYVRQTRKGVVKGRSG